MKWITLLFACCVCANQIPQTIFLQFIKEDVQEAHINNINQYIEIQQNGQILFEGKNHLALFLEIINHNNNDNKCFEMEKGKISYIYCHNISHIPNIIFGFTKKEVVVSQNLLFTYNKELSLYIMNISFIDDNNNNISVLNKELIIDNNVSEISFGIFSPIFQAIAYAIFMLMVIGVIFVIVIIILIICCCCKRNSKQNNANLINIQTSPKSLVFPYEPQDISQPQVIHQTMLALNNNIDYVIFPKVPIYNTQN
jgi:hypothetical protein